MDEGKVKNLFGLDPNAMAELVAGAAAVKQEEPKTRAVEQPDGAALMREARAAAAAEAKLIEQMRLSACASEQRVTNSVFGIVYKVCGGMAAGGVIGLVIGLIVRSKK